MRCPLEEVLNKQTPVGLLGSDSCKFLHIFRQAFFLVIVGDILKLVMQQVVNIGHYEIVLVQLIDDVFLVNFTSQAIIITGTEILLLLFLFLALQCIFGFQLFLLPLLLDQLLLQLIKVCSFIKHQSFHQNLVQIFLSVFLLNVKDEVKGACLKSTTRANDKLIGELSASQLWSKVVFFGERSVFFIHRLKLDLSLLLSHLFFMFQFETDVCLKILDLFKLIFPHVIVFFRRFLQFCIALRIKILVFSVFVIFLIIPTMLAIILTLILTISFAAFITLTLFLILRLILFILRLVSFIIFQFGVFLLDLIVGLLRCRRCRLGLFLVISS